VKKTTNWNYQLGPAFKKVLEADRDLVGMHKDEVREAFRARA